MRIGTREKEEWDTPGVDPAVKVSIENSSRIQRLLSAKNYRITHIRRMQEHLIEIIIELTICLISTN